jgi:hypothetical protein
MVQWVLLSYTIEEKNNMGLMLQWVVLSYTIEEKNNMGSDVTVSTVKLYNRRKNYRGLMVQRVLLSYTIEENTTGVWWYSEYC